MRVAILLCCVVLSVHAFIQPKVDPVQYESEWAIHVNDGVDPRTLEENGYEILGQVGNLENIYVVRHRDTHARHQSERSLRFVPSHDVTRSLMEHPDVKWAEQQFITKYNKRAITDPLFNDQWHLINTGQFSGVAGVDANVQGAWNLGFTGAGVRVAIVDDGYQTTHPDLAARYKADSSYSFNAPTGNPPDPNVGSDFHGTAASGVAMAANNSACGVGAAYMAEGAGIRLIAAGISDATSASGLTYRYQLNDIYSNSWGPGDDAISVAGPGSLTIAAIKDGTVTGRGGLGNVYVWAAGNGLLNNDNCNYDGYATMRQTIAVGAIGNNGKQSYYSEPCAAMLVTAPSNSANANAGIRTTDLLGTNGYSTTDCTTTFGGTSSACPLVAGVTALILQANPLLTWRDVHFILAKTATKNDPTDPDWATNAAGYHINHKYGFGKVDATAAVLAALNHTNLATEVIATSGTVTVGRAIPDNPATGITATTTVTTNVAIEKVLVTVRINHPTSGDLQITVISPLGTRSVMSTPHADVTVLYAGSTPYLVGTASFGANVTFAQVTGTITASTPANACTTITNCAALANKIAYVQRGTCDYTAKAKAVQLCGARGIVVVNNVATDGDAILNMGGTDATVTIPAVFLSYNDGQVVAAGQVGVITKTQYGVNSYQNGWTFATVRCLGESSAGTWSVLVEDGFPGGNGTFTSFKIDAYGSSSVPAATTAAGGAAATTAAGAAATTSSASGNAAATTSSAAASSTGTTGSAAGAGTSAGAAPSSTTSKSDESSASSLSAITLFVVLASLIAMNF